MGREGTVTQSAKGGLSKQNASKWVNFYLSKFVEH